jgi:hypothetical protein
MLKLCFYTQVFRTPTYFHLPWLSSGIYLTSIVELLDTLKFVYKMIAIYGKNVNVFNNQSLFLYMIIDFSFIIYFILFYILHLIG